MNYNVYPGEFSNMMLRAVKDKAGEIYTCYFDGACEPNPGGSIGAGICINYKGKDEFYTVSVPAAVRNSSNVAEYIAFSKLLYYLGDCEGCEIIIYGDSDLVVNQMNRRWRILGGYYKPYAFRAQDRFYELKQRNNVKLSWIPRERNAAADELSKQAIRQ